jgi:hypothetical protein
MASGVLNMTRGLGTALGLAFTGLVFGSIAGSRQLTPAVVTQGFEASTIFLSAVALVAAGLAAVRGGGQRHDGHRRRTVQPT